ncbi:phage tail sheath family protein [Actinokineospora inagensis]|uniref:phage tail sheath family protein n=1 Tax=Actinokineospora inagensis TaxID=103730 RepID=UPI00040CE59B|nr:phage tail sheath subtilisin-like domain-containing protein [Actinokineospora inagensis]
MPNYLSPGVYVEEVESGSRPIEGVGTAVAAFVGLAERGPYDEPTLVTNWGQFTQTFGDFVDGGYLAQAVFGYFLNGGTTCYVVRVGASENGNGSGPEPAQARLGNYRVAVKQLPPAESRDGKADEITVEVADPTEENAPDDRFTLLVKQNGKVVETHSATTKRGKENIVTVVREKSALITVEEVAAGALVKPDRGSVLLAPPPATVESISADDIVGDVADRTGFGGLEVIDEVTMVAVPDLMGLYQRDLIDLEGVQAVQTAMIAHAELMGDRLAILDTPPALNPQQAKQWRDDVNYDTRYAALYYPWIKVADPSGDGAVFVPPSGHLAGVWARNDGTRGVHKAPANEVVRGVLSLQSVVTQAEQALLNPVGVNCLRSFTGRGIRVWGARTLSSDSDWRYLNVRRLFNYLEESILNGTQWVVFEPNDEALWARIRRTISSFLVMEWRRGALFGSTPDEAFYVKCDQETNPAESIDSGHVVCEIGVAPVKPAEFVVFRLAQLSGGTSLVNE